MDISAPNLQILYTGFKAAFEDAFRGVKPQYPRIAMTVPSSTAAETYAWMEALPRIREWLDERVVKSLGTRQMQVVNRTFESTIGVKREQIEDDQYGIFATIFAQLGLSTGNFPDELLFPLLNAGFTTQCFDGQNFFDPNHPVKDANGNITLVSNMQAGPGPYWFLLDTTQIVKPLVWQTRRPFDFISKTDPRVSDSVFKTNEFVYGTDGRCNAGLGLWQLAFGSGQPLNSANFRAARQTMIDMKGDFGRPLGLNPDLLVYPPTLDGTARDLIMSERLANGASNTDWKLVDLMKSAWLG
ncbi:MAG: Mu-like prophage major head subunit gpT family protein [Hyphomicrobiales bacterium]|nr:Mu-like prophage major head subunit gpT family protein [Hyphomicrobiales bacterium]MDE2113832.1 Mu-like prophage major head subunit gpT family protein [Hyphomicrobiales bacterium]